MSPLSVNITKNLFLSPPMKPDTLLLAGDIGGTRTRLAVYAMDDWPGPPLRQQTFLNHKATGLPDLVTAFLAEVSRQPSVGCFGIAGPIRGDRIRMTNLDWQIDARHLEKTFGLQQVFLINDLVATAMGAVLLPEQELFTIHAGRPQPNGNIAVLAPGTGLGQAFMLKRKQGFLPVASEGGHSSFAPRNHQQIELLEFLLRKEAHISVEKVCSGLGIPNLYDFLAGRLQQPEPLRRELADASDRTPVLVNAGLKAFAAGDSDHICVQTLRLFTDILAAEAANLALKVLATGGIFLGGGIPPRMLPFFSSERFLEVFARGIYREMLAEIPIHVILNPKAALLGAAAYGFNQICPDNQENTPCDTLT